MHSTHTPPSGTAAQAAPPPLPEASAAADAAAATGPGGYPPLLHVPCMIIAASGSGGTGAAALSRLAWRTGRPGSTTKAIRTASSSSRERSRCAATPHAPCCAAEVEAVDRTDRRGAVHPRHAWAQGAASMHAGAYSGAAAAADAGYGAAGQEGGPHPCAPPATLPPGECGRAAGARDSDEVLDLPAGVAAKLCQVCGAPCDALSCKRTEEQPSVQRGGASCMDSARAQSLHLGNGHR